jgi:formyl-CoA transferase
MDALQGLKVLERGQLIAGPFAAKTLAEFGADVIKIEPAEGGDPLRAWRLLRNGTSVWWEVQSRNRRSVALHQLNPRLIMLRVSGYGQTGPVRGQARLWRAG